MANVLTKKIVKHGGPRMRDMYTFEAIFDAYPDKSQISAEQRKLGYHPAGYGITDLTITQVPNHEATTAGPAHLYKCVWKCWGSCD